MKDGVTASRTEEEPLTQRAEEDLWEANRKKRLDLQTAEGAQKIKLVSAVRGGDGGWGALTSVTYSDNISSLCLLFRPSLL